MVQQKRMTVLVVVMLLLSTFHVVIGQAAVRTFEPVTTTIKLGSTEPLPPGIRANVEFGGWGGGPMEGPPAAVETAWRWLYAPSVLGDPLYTVLTACGPFTAAAPASVIASVEHPEADVMPAVVASLSPAFDPMATSGRCWNYEIVWKRGMPLGLYTLTLHPLVGKDISYTLGLDYPFCAVRTDDFGLWGKDGIVPSHSQQRLEQFYGYQPHQNLVLDFYFTKYDKVTKYEPAKYLTSRTVETDDEGALWIEIELERSAPVREVNAVAFIVRGENVPGAEGASELLAPEPTKGCFGDYPDAAALMEITPSVGWLELRANNPTGNEVQIYRTAGDVSSKIDTIQNGMVVSVFEQQPLLTDGRVMGWYHLKYGEGKLGWAYGPTFQIVHIAPPTATPLPQVCGGSLPSRLTVNELAYITPGPANHLRDTPTGKIIATVPGGSQIMVVGGPTCGLNNRTYWLVEYNGKRGWTAESNDKEYWIAPVPRARAMFVQRTG